MRMMHNNSTNRKQYKTKPALACKYAVLLVPVVHGVIFLGGQHTREYSHIYKVRCL